MGQLWTEADEQLLLKLHEENSLLGRPALLLLFNSQASQPRSLGSVDTKLSKLGR